MKNNRSLFPPLFGEIPTGGGGGGSGNKIQLAELPEASLQYKDKIVQYIGATTDTLTNGYFYKCVEHTTTEGETITVTYSWDNVDIMNSSVNVFSILNSSDDVLIGKDFSGNNLYYRKKSLTNPSDGENIEAGTDITSIVATFGVYKRYSTRDPNEYQSFPIPYVGNFPVPSSGMKSVGVYLTYDVLADNKQNLVFTTNMSTPSGYTVTADIGLIITKKEGD